MFSVSIVCRSGSFGRLGTKKGTTTWNYYKVLFIVKSAIIQVFTYTNYDSNEWSRVYQITITSIYERVWNFWVQMVKVKKIVLFCFFLNWMDTLFRSSVGAVFSFFRSALRSHIQFPLLSTGKVRPSLFGVKQREIVAYFTPSQILELLNCLSLRGNWTCFLAGRSWDIQFRSSYWPLIESTSQCLHLILRKSVWKKSWFSAQSNTVNNTRFRWLWFLVIDCEGSRIFFPFNKSQYNVLTSTKPWIGTTKGTNAAWMERFFWSKIVFIT